MKRQRIASIASITGCIVLLLATGITMERYVGRQGERFSMINHFVSELGWEKVSILAPFFNVALTVASVLFVPLAVELARLFLGWRRIVIGWLAFAVFVSIGLIGFFPMNKVAPHLALAFVFFPSALALFSFMAVITLFSKQPVLPKWTAFVSFLTVIPFAALGVVPKDRLWSWVTDPAHFVRPDFWLLSVVEWACFFTVLVWIISMAIVLWSPISTREATQSHMISGSFQPSTEEAL